MCHYFIGLWCTQELGTFLISEDPSPNFELFPTETWDFFDFLTNPRFLVRKASLTYCYCEFCKMLPKGQDRTQMSLKCLPDLISLLG